MPTHVIIAMVIFLGVAAFVGAGLLIYNQVRQAQYLGKRLDQATQRKVATVDAGDILREPMFPEETGTLLEKLTVHLPSLTKLFAQADFKRSPQEFWMITAGLGGLGAAGPWLVGMPIVASTVGAVVLAALPLGYVWFLRKHRLGKFAAQLCEALELIARALRAGHSLAAGMQVVSEEMPSPIATEFRRVWDEQNMGMSIEEALRALADRVPNLDLRFFVTAVVIQKQTGGDLAEILDKIGSLIRERFKILGMVKALTGEGRISGIVLIALPFLLLLVMMSISPQYISKLWTTDMGIRWSIYGIVLMIIGALAIKKIVDIKV